MIAIDDVRDHLLTLDQVRETLETTEPLTDVRLTRNDEVRFHLENGWNHDSKTLEGVAAVDATLRVGGKEYALTKDALLEAARVCGLTPKYVQRTPARLVEPVLNWYFQDGTDVDYKALVVDGRVFGVTKASLQPFSNLRLMNEVLAAVAHRYGAGEVLADRKFTHSLRKTALRLIVPEHQRVIEHTGTDNDSWSVGVEITNSLAGEHATSFQGYLFRYWCTNGSVDTHATSGTWSRRNGSGDDVYEWARNAVDDVLGGLEGTLDRVQEMADTSIQGEAVVILRDVFKRYRVPAPQQQVITNAMVETPHLTEYSLMQAVTSAANNPELSASLVDQLLRAGGNLPHALSSRCESCRRMTAL
jgi:hypothetical protein